MAYGKWSKNINTLVPPLYMILSETRHAGAISFKLLFPHQKLNIVQYSNVLSFKNPIIQ